MRLFAKILGSKPKTPPRATPEDTEFRQQTESVIAKARIQTRSAYADLDRALNELADALAEPNDRRERKRNGL